jgi:hypothetical protein
VFGLIVTVDAVYGAVVKEDRAVSLIRTSSINPLKYPGASPALGVPYDVPSNNGVEVLFILRDALPATSKDPFMYSFIEVPSYVAAMCVQLVPCDTVEDCKMAFPP